MLRLVDMFCNSHTWETVWPSDSYWTYWTMFSRCSFYILLEIWRPPCFQYVHFTLPHLRSVYSRFYLWKSKSISEVYIWICVEFLLSFFLCNSCIAVSTLVWENSPTFKVANKIISAVFLVLVDIEIISHTWILFSKLLFSPIYDCTVLSKYYENENLKSGFYCNFRYIFELLRLNYLSEMPQISDPL